jgi:multidrug efflux system membrane fusion protein
MRPVVKQALVVALVAGGGALLWSYWPAPLPAARPAARQISPMVEVAIAQALDLPVYVRGIGRVEAFNGVDIKSRVDGQIERVPFTEGAEVKAGEPLFEIDPRPYQAVVAQSEAQISKDQAQLTSAQADLVRVSSLQAKGFASSQALDAQNSAVAQFAAAIKIDRAALDTARLMLDFTTIRAPFAGRVGKRLVDAGALIRAADGTALVKIVQVHPISVLLNVPQDALPEIARGLQAGRLTMEVLAADDRRTLAEGTLVLIENTVDSQTGTIELKGVFDNADGALWPGQLVNGRVVTRMLHDVVAIPNAAVQTGPAGKFVYVVDANGNVGMRSVKPGAPVPGLAAIDSGLQPGERVVVDGQDQLAPGMTVKVSKESSGQGNDPATSGKIISVQPS